MLAGIGGFGAQIALPRLKNPVAVLPPTASAPNSKSRRQADAADGLGIDLVAMCANDAICAARARSRFGLLRLRQTRPGFRGALARFDRARLRDRRLRLGRRRNGGNARLVSADRIRFGRIYARALRSRGCLAPANRNAPRRRGLGLASTGAHSNGYSLIRAILARAEIGLDARVDGAPLAELLLAPTRIYVRAVAALFAAARPRALCHVTGGGLESNLARVLPPACAARIDFDSWPRPPLFDFLRRAGGVAEEEMRRVLISASAWLSSSPPIESTIRSLLCARPARPRLSSARLPPRPC